MSVVTYAEVAERTGIAVPDNLDIPAELIAQAEVPLAPNGWMQGDVNVRPEVHEPQGDGIPLSGSGHKVVAGDAERNSHVLNGDGLFFPGVYKARRDTLVLDYGLLVVPAGGVAVLTHTGEHGSVAFPGGDDGASYRVWGQLSYEQELARAAD